MSALAFVVTWFVLCCAAVVLFFIISNSRRNRRAHAARQTVQNLLNEHLDTLARRRLSLARNDHYGVEDRKSWDREVGHFLTKVVSPRLSEGEKNALFGYGYLPPDFEQQVQQRAKRIADVMDFRPDMSPIEFEVWCFNTLRRSGWKCHTTSVTGDQGADIVAEKSNTRLIVQCKLYNAPVGNKAVQEAWAAMRHYSATRAAVVTNAQFTKAARELASTTGVLLLHVSDLAGVDAWFEADVVDQTP